MPEKKEVIGLSVIKAILTTAIIGLAINRFIELVSTTDLATQINTTVAIAVTCLAGTILYSVELSKTGILKSARSFFHTYDLNWDDNVMYLGKSWVEATVLAGILVLSSILSSGSEGGYYTIVISLVSSGLTVYIMRKDCKTTFDYIKYAILGYIFGIALVATGLLISFLISLFGIYWVGLLIVLDAGFTGVYTYLDLLEWEREQNKNIEAAKISAGLK